MASTYLTRTFDQVGNRQTWTLSVWIKRTGLGGTQTFFCSFPQSTDYERIMFNSDKIYICEVGGGATTWECETSARYRDTNAWYHLVLRHDTTQSSANDRIRLYMNGVQQTFATNTQPAQNRGTQINTADVHKIGMGNASEYTDCVMSHFHWCDGYSYAPTEFGETDSTTGEWKIKTSPSVSYGTNGFFILKDGNSVTDQSGGSHNWTVGGGTLTQTADCPSNVFCTLNSNIPQNGTLNGRDGATSTSLDNGNTTAGEGAAVFSNQVGSIFASSGKYYAECKFGGDQYCSFGVANPNFSDASLGSYPGASITGVNTAGIYGNGGIARVNGSTIFTDSNITTDTICLAMDLDNGALYIRRNDGSWMNSGNPESGATKTGAITLPSDTYTWIVTSHNNSGSGRNYMKVNFGNGYFGSTQISSAGTNASGIGIFEYDVPTGYTALSTKGLNL